MNDFGALGDGAGWLTSSCRRKRASWVVNIVRTEGRQVNGLVLPQVVRPLDTGKVRLIASVD
jgi:hypothetical protein